VREDVGRGNACERDGAVFVDAINFHKQHAINFWRFADAGTTSGMRRIFLEIVVNSSAKNETADERR